MIQQHLSKITQLLNREKDKMDKEVELFKNILKEQLQDEIKTVQILLDTCKEELDECMKLLKSMESLNNYEEENEYDD